MQEGESVEITPDTIKIDNNVLSEFSNPFNKEGLTKIEFTIHKPYTEGDPIEHTSQVWFKKNGTTGIQDIEAEDFPALVRKTQMFIDLL